MHSLDLVQYRTILASSDWQAETSALPAEVANWLLHTDSLTQKLQAIWADLTVEIIQQGWQGGRSCLFSAKSSELTKVWSREVILRGDKQPRIFAQTLLPEETVAQVAQDVLTLGDTPIGLWLFPQNPIRLRLEWRKDPDSGLYARRSLLMLHGYPLAIYELFLPDFPFSS